MVKSIIQKAAWPILIASALAFIAAALYSRGTVARLSSDTGTTIPGSESASVTTQLGDKFGRDSGDGIILFASKNPQLHATDPAYQRAVAVALAKLGPVKAVQSYYTALNPQFVSRDHTKMYAVVTLPGTKDQKVAALEAFQSNASSADLNITVGGSVIATHEAISQVEHDLSLAEMISLPILALVLLFVFRSVVAALLPFILGLFAIVGGISVLRLMTYVTDIDQYSINVITLLGLGLAVDYSLLMVGRFREELARGNDSITATHITLTTAGRTILFSGITVIVSLLSLAIFPITLLRSIGLGGAAAIMIALAAALIILPALLRVLGRNINKWPVPFTSHRALPDAQNLWGRFARYITRHPALAVAGAMLVILALALPLKDIHFIGQDYHSLAAGSGARNVADVINTDFAQQAPPVTVLLTRDQLATAAGLKDVAAAEAAIRQLPGVSSVMGPAETGRNPHFINGDTAQIVVNYTDGGPSDATAQGIVKAIRALPAAGYQLQVGGAPAQQYDLVTTIVHYLPYALLAIIVTILIVLSILLKSITLPVQAVIINSFSLLAALGIVVWIFQQGHLTGFTWLTKTGGLDVTTPVLIFAISFGLSMDYAVFLYSRIQEEHAGGQSTEDAIVRGVELTGPIITEAAALFFIVVIAFASSRIPTLQQIGLGMGLAVIIDAFFVRIILVPAVMKLVGKYNWIYPN